MRTIKRLERPQLSWFVLCKDNFSLLSLLYLLKHEISLIIQVDVAVLIAILTFADEYTTRTF